MSTQGASNLDDHARREGLSFFVYQPPIDPPWEEGRSQRCPARLSVTFAFPSEEDRRCRLVQLGLHWADAKAGHEELDDFCGGPVSFAFSGREMTIGIEGPELLSDENRAHARRIENWIGNVHFAHYVAPPTVAAIAGPNQRDVPASDRALTAALDAAISRLQETLRRSTWNQEQRGLLENGHDELVSIRALDDAGERLARAAAIPKRTPGGREGDDAWASGRLVPLEALDTICDPVCTAGRQGLSSPEVSRFLREHANDPAVIRLWLQLGDALPRSLGVHLALAHPGNVRRSIGASTLVLMAECTRHLRFCRGAFLERPGHPPARFAHPVQPQLEGKAEPYVVVKTAPSAGIAAHQPVIIDCEAARASFPQSSMQRFWREGQRFERIEPGGVFMSKETRIGYQQLRWESLEGA